MSDLKKQNTVLSIIAPIKTYLYTIRFDIKSTANKLHIVWFPGNLTWLISHKHHNITFVK